MKEGTKKGKTKDKNNQNGTNKNLTKCIIIIQKYQ